MLTKPIHTVPLTATPMRGLRHTLIGLVACPPDQPSHTVETVAVSYN